MKKVSVIVPVYKAEPYLRECLDSILNQTLSDIEIIIVNDGSPDNSQDIIDEYKKKYKNIRAFKQKNKGQSAARNFALSKVKGEYISFIDSDDYVDLNMLKEQYEYALEGNYEVVCSDFTCFFKDRKKDYSRQTGIFSDITDEAGIKKYLIDLYPVVCSKLYKADIFKTLRFKEGYYFEDMEILYRLIPNLKRIGYINEPHYKYRQVEGSTTHSMDDRIFNYYDNWDTILDYYKKNDLFDKYKNELEYSYVRYMYATFLKRALSLPKAKFKTAYKMAREGVKANFPSYRKNKYFYKSLKGIYLVIFNILFLRIGSRMFGDKI